MRNFRLPRFVRGAAVVGSVLALTAGAGLLTAGPAGATVSNPGSVQVALAESLTINGPIPIVIPGVAGTVTGTVDSAGNLVFPMGSVSFPPFQFLIGGAIPTTVTIQATADWTGTIDPTSGALNISAPQTAHLDLSAALPGDSDCPVGPLPINLTTGTSGAATGTPYSTSTGSAEIVDGTFAIPAVPDSPLPPNCPDADTINAAGGLPLSGGLSLADVTATFTPILVADGDLGLSGVPADITTNATSPTGATVTYPSPTATDEDVPPTSTVSCVPGSGSLFAIGPTTVTCTASDADDTPNTVSQTFTVTVKGAAAQLQDLLGFVQPLGPGTSFFDQVSAVLASYNAGNSADACGGLTAFINHAKAQAGKTITTGQANFMVTSAARIRNVIGC
jgi:hypothetical protein